MLTNRPTGSRSANSIRRIEPAMTTGKPRAHRRVSLLPFCVWPTLKPCTLFPVFFSSSFYYMRVGFCSITWSVFTLELMFHSHSPHHPIPIALSGIFWNKTATLYLLCAEILKCDRTKCGLSSRGKAEYGEGFVAVLLSLGSFLKSFAATVEATAGKSGTVDPFLLAEPPPVAEREIMF